MIGRKLLAMGMGALSLVAVSFAAAPASATPVGNGAPVAAQAVASDGLVTNTQYYEGRRGYRRGWERPGFRGRGPAYRGRYARGRVYGRPVYRGRPGIYRRGY